MFCWFGVCFVSLFQISLYTSVWTMVTCATDKNNIFCTSCCYGQTDHNQQGKLATLALGLVVVSEQRVQHGF